MKILYLSQRFDFNSAGIYSDLINELKFNNHEVTILTCDYKNKTEYDKVHQKNNLRIIYSRVPNQFVSNKFIKGITQMILPFLMIKTYKRTLKGTKFDLILHPTPPITFYYIIKYLKKQNKFLKSYLMLKDIFPQNAVDLGFFKKGSLIYKIYKNIEKKLYKISDKIGCMSKGNVDYIIEKNRYLEKSKIEIFPNTMKKYKKSFMVNDNKKIRFIIGGNLGLPQDIPFIMDCLLSVKDQKNIEFIIAGKGTYSKYIYDFIRDYSLNNVSYVGELDRIDYEDLVKTCQIGIISLNYDFTIPNIPARFLSYISKGLPVLLISDMTTDLKKIILNEAKCGFWIPSNDVKKFSEIILEIYKSNLLLFSSNAYKYFIDNYDVKYSVQILERFYRKEIL